MRTATAALFSLVFLLVRPALAVTLRDVVVEACAFAYTRLDTVQDCERLQKVLLRHEAALRAMLLSSDEKLKARYVMSLTSLVEAKNALGSLQAVLATSQLRLSREQLDHAYSPQNPEWYAFQQSRVDAARKWTSDANLSAAELTRGYSVRNLGSIGVRLPNGLG